MLRGLPEKGGGYCLILSPLMPLMPLFRPWPPEARTMALTRGCHSPNQAPASGLVPAGALGGNNTGLKVS